MFGKSAQTEGLSLNIKASDTWNFFQAKTIRQTTLRTAAQAMTVEATTVPDDARKAALLKQADEWMKTVARYESDPAEKDGRKELRALAEKYEHDRDTQLTRYHHYEFASAACQIAIVLASAAVITGMVALVSRRGLGRRIGFMGLGSSSPRPAPAPCDLAGAPPACAADAHEQAQWPGARPTFGGRTSAGV
jgi:hypothetical protein